jgi:hypothetical protein
MIREYFLGRSEDLYDQMEKLRTVLAGRLGDWEAFINREENRQLLLRYTPGKYVPATLTFEIVQEQILAVPYNGQLAVVRQKGNPDEPEVKQVDVILIPIQGKIIIFSNGFSLSRESGLREFRLDDDVCLPEVWEIDRKLEVIGAMKSSLGV